MDNWENKLTSEEIKHLREVSDGTLKSVKKIFEVQAKMRENGGSEPCWDCRFIEEKLNHIDAPVVNDSSLNKSETCFLLAVIRSCEVREVYKGQDYLITKMRTVRDKLIKNGGMSIEEINTNGWGEIVPINNKGDYNGKRT